MILDRLNYKIEQLERVHIMIRGHIVLCEDYRNHHHGILSSIVTGSCIFHDCEAYGIELRTLKFTILDTQSILSPRIVPDANMALSTHIKIRLHILKTNSDFYEKCKFLVLQEIYLLRS